MEVSRRRSVLWGIRLALAVAAVTGLLWSTGLALGRTPLEAAVQWGPVMVAVVGLNLFIARRRRRHISRSISASLTVDQREVAIRASRGGPVPEEPEVRLEAARLMCLRVGPAGDNRLTMIIFGGAIVAFAVGGCFASRWFWVSAAASLLGAAVVAWAQRTTAQRVQALVGDRGSTRGLPAILVPVDASAASAGVGTLIFHPRTPVGGSSWSTLLLSIDDRPVPVAWGASEIQLPVGQHRVAAWASFAWDFGRAEITIDVTAGSVLDLHDSPPVITLLGGRMGPVRQPRRGVLASLVGFPAIFALLILGLTAVAPHLRPH